MIARATCEVSPALEMDRSSYGAVLAVVLSFVLFFFSSMYILTHTTYDERESSAEKCMQRPFPLKRSVGAAVNPSA